MTMIFRKSFYLSLYMVLMQDECISVEAIYNSFQDKCKISYQTPPTNKPQPDTALVHYELVRTHQQT